MMWIVLTWVAIAVAGVVSTFVLAVWSEDGTPVLTPFVLALVNAAGTIKMREIIISTTNIPAKIR
jgi:uncharacterized OB-fold protein